MKVVRHKRKNKDIDSPNGMESEGREDEEKDQRTRLLNVVLLFKGEGRVKRVSPIKLTNSLNDNLQM